MNLSDVAAIEETPAERRRRRVKQTVARSLLALAVYGAMVLAARSLHRRVLYQPPDAPAAEAPEGTKLRTFTAKDGVAVHVLELTAKKPKRTIVHFHGNAETVDDSAHLGRELVKRGFSVVLVEYRGYGRSRGVAPDEAGLYADGHAVLDGLAKEGVSGASLVLWGQALGAGIAVEMARHHEAASLVLVAPMTSTVALGRHALPPVLPMSLVMVDRYDSLAKAPSIDVPALVVHGAIDDVIPFEQGEALAKALAHGRLLRVPEGRHDGLYKVGSVFSEIVEHASR